MAIDIRRDLKNILPHLKKAQEDNLNEADTILRIIKVLEQVLGYDGLTEITREQQIKDKYADIAVRIDGSIKFLIEAKASGVVLRDRHIEQAERYAAEGNIRWVVLTNGVMWNLYHLSFEEGIEYERAFTVDLGTDPIDKAAELLALLHRQSIIRGEHEDFWKKQAALNPQSIGRVLFFEDTLKLIRRQIRKQEGIFVDIEDLGMAIQSLFSPETREQIGPFKIRKKRSPRREDKKPQETVINQSPSIIEDSQSKTE
jgi:hypothetical protein